MLKEKYRELVAGLKDEVVRHYGERLVTLAIFGSVASETMRPDSDLDIFICAEGLPRGRSARMKDFMLIEEALSPLLAELRANKIYCCLSPAIKTPQETECGSLIFIDMTENVKILFDRNAFFENHLNKLRNKMKALGSKKIMLGSAWYWDLIPNYKMVGEVDL